MTMIDVRPVEGLDIAVVNADDVFLKDEDTAIEEIFPTKFWDPTTGFPGRVLDRLIQNDVKMVVVGDFNAYANGPFLDFMAECNNGFNLFFVADEDTAFKRLVNALNDDKKLNR